MIFFLIFFVVLSIVFASIHLIPLNGVRGGLRRETDNTGTRNPTPCSLLENTASVACNVLL